METQTASHIFAWRTDARLVKRRCELSEPDLGPLVTVITHVSARAERAPCQRARDLAWNGEGFWSRRSSLPARSRSLSARSMDHRVGLGPGVRPAAPVSW